MITTVGSNKGLRTEPYQYQTSGIPQANLERTFHQYRKRTSMVLRANLERTASEPRAHRERTSRVPQANLDGTAS